jgi:hypothetical protein
MLVDVPAGATLTHEEHAHLRIPAGRWLVRLQTEWSAIGSGMTRVVD